MSYLPPDLSVGIQLVHSVFYVFSLMSSFISHFLLICALRYDFSFAVITSATFSQGRP
jgi:hypothetical protein